ncbi:MAG: single-stranded DNA-binding protein [Firmicutes bacterium]|nr:single-stranded DNA-binding protein [Bacillota bacterium]
MNKVLLTGRLTREPESRMSQGSMEIVRFGLACRNDFINKEGERDTEFVNCVAFGRTANTISRFCHQGDLINATGRIRNNNYEAQDGTKRYSTDIVIEQIEFLMKKGGSTNNYTNNYNNGGNYQNNNYNNANYNTNNASYQNNEMADLEEDPYKDMGDELGLSKDDLPFYH